MEAFYKTIENEIEQPRSGTVNGTIPCWVNGSLYRNGPGMYEIGKHKFKHLFDGMAMLQRFHISNGNVTYQRRFLRSDAYVKNNAAGRIVVAEFGTPAIPDPCKNIFQRFLTMFEPSEPTDNTLVNVFSFTNDLYAVTETYYMNKIDPHSLEITEKVNLMEKVGADYATAHPHLDSECTLHNIGHSRLNTVFYTVPQKKDGESRFPCGEIVAKLPSPWKLHCNYVHSFGMTEHYYVFIEQPLLINIPKVLISKPVGNTVGSCLTYHPEIKTRFRLVNRKTGTEEKPDVKYEADAFMFFHQINAYEENDHVVLDLSCYRSKQLLDNMYMKNVTSSQTVEFIDVIKDMEARRYVIPLNVDKASTGIDLVTLPNTNARCKQVGNKTFHCEAELLADVAMEFPQINYEKYNSKKYRYVYGIGFHVKDGHLKDEHVKDEHVKDGHVKDEHYQSLVKIDINTKNYIRWIEDKCYPSEPVFVPNPSGTAEDDGVLVAAINKLGEDDTNCFLLVLDAVSFKEIARVEFEHVDRFPRDFHGCFTSDNE